MPLLRPPAYRWGDLARPEAVDGAAARWAEQVAEDRLALERAMVDEYGLWAIGWCWDDDDETVDAEAGLRDWWQMLGELGEAFAGGASDDELAAMAGHDEDRAEAYQAWARQARGEDAPDHAADWPALRGRNLQPVPIGTPRVDVTGDGHRGYVDRFEAEQAEARHAAIDAARASNEPITVAALARWSGLAVRDLDSAARLDGWLVEAGDARVPTAVRAARAYLDVAFARPFVDDNPVAARLALDAVLTRSKLALHVAEPLFRLPVAADPRLLWRCTFVIDRIAGRVTSGPASSARRPP